MSKEVKKDVGIYTITNKETGEYYNGSGDLKRREMDHFLALRKGQHVNKRFQEAYNRNPNFKFRGTLTPDRYSAFNLEQIAIDESQGDPLSLNLAMRVGDCKNLIVTPENLDKLRQRMLGNTYTKGRSHTEEAREKIRQARTGLVATEPVRENMRQAQNYPRTEAQKNASLGTIVKAQEANSSPVVIQNTEYSSIQAAARKLELAYSTVRKRVLSNTSRFDEWKFQNNHS